jgi:hypothetical protein
MTVPSSQQHYHQAQSQLHRQQSAEGYAGACLCQSAKNSNSSAYTSAPAHEHFHSTTERSSSSWTTILCSHCVRNVFHAAHERHSQAIQRHDIVRRECASQFAVTSSNKGNLSQLQFELEQAGDRLASLRTKCAAAAVQVATKAVQNDEQHTRRCDTPNDEYQS